MQVLVSKMPISVLKSVTVAVAVATTVFAVSEAGASKARIGTLQGALGLVDTQTVFSQPAYIHKLSPYVTYEFGSNSASGTPKAEGGFLMNRDGKRWGAYLGHQSVFQNVLRSIGTYQRQDNPVDLFYGQDNWAANLSLSNSEDENTGAKQTTVIGRFGMTRAEDEFFGQVEILADAEKPNNKFRGAPVLQAGYLRRVDDLTFQGDVTYADGTHDNAGSKKLKFTGVNLAVNHRPVAEIYYGVGFEWGALEEEGKKLDTLAFPVFIGVEKDMFSWMTVRGSVRQNVLLGSTKNEIANGKPQRNLNNTTVAAGLGFKHNGFTFDGALAAANTGALNGTTFLTTASLTYNF